MKTIILILLITYTVSYSQTFEVEKLSGNVKILSGNSNTWQDLKTNAVINSNSIISTDKKSYVKIKGNDIIFTLKESSAISVANIKKMSLDELILALAMEDVMDTPMKKRNEKSDNTGVYGEKITGETLKTIKSNDFGLKRLKGAKQLAENGMKESAIVAAKEIFRKYPETKKDAGNRIYFADLLYNRGLYEEAYEEFNQIKLLQLTSEQSSYTKNRLDEIGKKLIK
jgi:hypothetical protein